MHIDYSLIAKADEFYSKAKFTKVEVPWAVTEAISNITKPPGRGDYHIGDGKVLVASGEQSFLYQYLKGFLPKGRFFTTTPCFRKETFDELHTKYFIKTELIDTTDNMSLDFVIESALTFYKSIFPSADLRIENIDKFSYDITFNGDELGSYGIRECNFLKWVYGTGIAEPRASFLLQKYKVSR